jgi:hypothetical protein
VSLIRFSPLQDVCAAVAWLPDGGAVATGFAVLAHHKVDIGVTRVNEFGILDSHFGVQGKRLVDLEQGIDVPHAVSVDARSVYIGGEFQTQKSRPAGIRTNGFFLLRLKHDGSSDPDYHEHGVATYSWEDNFPAGAQSMIYVDDGLILAGQAQGNVTILKFSK